MSSAMAQFVHHDLRLLNPRFSSPLLDVVTDLEYLRRLEMSGTTPYCVFAELKQVFHFLESLASARIEGNHTTLADYVESKVASAHEPTEEFREIENIESAMSRVEEAVQPGAPVTEALIRGLHAVTVKDLTREGDSTPGAYRRGSVSIHGAEHQPPEAIEVARYMHELEAFVNTEDPPKYELMKVALAHHRFAWIHPFGNGNGRVVRLLTYAMLLKYGFRVSAHGRLLNPTAVFCADRNRYYSMLALADRGTDDALEEWCIYVLTGVRDELKKVDRLADYKYLQTAVLLPALAYARERRLITPPEEAVLSATVKRGEVKAGDLESTMPGLNAAQRTYRLKKLVTAGMLQPVQEGARQYTVGFSHNVLLRGVIRALTDQGFISPALQKAPATPAAGALEPAA
jgi:Fic family protein